MSNILVLNSEVRLLHKRWKELKVISENDETLAASKKMIDNSRKGIIDSKLKTQEILETVLKIREQTAEEYFNECCSEN